MLRSFAFANYALLEAWIATDGGNFQVERMMPGGGF